MAGKKDKKPTLHQLHIQLIQWKIWVVALANASARLQLVQNTFTIIHAICLFAEEWEGLIKKYGSTAYVGISQVQNGIVYLRYGSSSKINKQRSAKLLYMKTFSYSNVKYTPRVPFILLIVKKIECENFDFVLFLLSFSFLSSFPSHITQKVYDIYERSAHQMTVLLPEIILFLVLELHAS